jgi:cysteinyl-tRNA synthetase
MASDVLGSRMDIHSGGIDLAFPHHDNELAQSEAYHCKCPGESDSTWVNCECCTSEICKAMTDGCRLFAHGPSWYCWLKNVSSPLAGHECHSILICDVYRSKSLKNFTTIREALEKGTWTPRGLRIVFLLGSWKQSLEITEEVMSTAKSFEEKMNNFFLKAVDLQINPTQAVADSETGLSPDGPLKEALKSAQISLQDALCDSFDTPTALRILSDLVSAVNSETGVSDETTTEIATWITSILNMFGLDASPSASGLGWSGIAVPVSVAPFVYALSKVRDEVRKQAIAGTMDASAILSQFDATALKTRPSSPEGAQAAEATMEWLSRLNELIKSEAPPKSFMPLCDELRDTTLWNLGIYLEDRVNAPALVRPLNADLREERANREALASLKFEKAKAAKEAKEKEERERLEKGKLSHLEMFRSGEYSEWDEEGLPVKDKEGKEVAKSKGKKLRKDWERQKKLHEAWVAASK